MQEEENFNGDLEEEEQQQQQEEEEYNDDEAYQDVTAQNLVQQVMRHNAYQNTTDTPTFCRHGHMVVFHSGTSSYVSTIEPLRRFTFRK